MKNFLFAVILISTFTACASKKTVDEPETLPKDIALKPENNYSQQLEKDKMTDLIKEIDAQIAGEICNDPSEWRSTPIGSKPCGGPGSYIAYPKKMEDEILPKVRQFTSMQSAFNTKYQLMSDCAIVPPPVRITCIDGKAVLISASMDAVEVAQ